MNEYVVYEYVVNEYVVYEYVVYEYVVNEYVVYEYAVYEYVVYEYAVNDRLNRRKPTRRGYIIIYGIIQFFKFVTVSETGLQQLRGQMPGACQN